MGKLTTYLIMMLGITALFYFSGLTVDCEDESGARCTGGADCLCVSRAPSSTLLNLVLHSQNTENSLYSKISLGLLGITTLGLLAVSILYRNIKLAVLSPIAMYLLAFIGDFVTVISKIWSVYPLVSVMVILVISPLLIHYIVTIIEWWSGTD